MYLHLEEYLQGVIKVGMAGRLGDLSPTSLTLLDGIHNSSFCAPQVLSTEFLAFGGEDTLPGLVAVQPALPSDQLPGKQPPNTHVALFQTVQYMQGQALTKLKVGGLDILLQTGCAAVTDH